MIRITGLRPDEVRPVATIDEEMEELSAAVSRHLAGAGAEVPETRDLAFRLGRVEDALAGLRAGQSQIVNRMITFVCFAIGSRPTEMMSERRARHLAHGRFAVMWAATKLTTFSYPRIAGALGGFDHTSIIHGVRRADQLRVTDPDFRKLTDAMIDHFTADEPEQLPMLPLAAPTTKEDRR